MSVKIRLARRGRKNLAMYRIVAADARAPRDGRFIKKLGTYDPHKAPAEVQLQEKRILEWLDQGAQPTETVRSLCSSMGLMLVRHLAQGVQKGAITPWVARKRFVDWHKSYKTKKNKKVHMPISPEQAEDIFKSIVPLPARQAQSPTKKNTAAPDSKNQPRADKSPSTS